MGRRKKQGAFEDLFDIAAAVPWWGGVSLALVTFLLAHGYAQSAGEGIGKVVASFAQYILPLPLLAGAVASAFGRFKRERLFVDAIGHGKGGALRELPWQDFELLVGEMFRRKGYSVEETGGGGADGGVDLRLRQGGLTFLVQCKHWRAYKVPVGVVREMYGVIKAQDTAGGFVVTSGVFTSEAIAFAHGKGIELIDGAVLRSFPSGAMQSVLSERTLVSEGATLTTAPHCPNCNETMVRRTAKRGASAGHVFWGCSSFPKCRGIRAIE